MNDSSRYAINSFVLVLYGGDSEALDTFQLPVSIAAPFANRLFDEVPGLPDWHTLREPWYVLKPRFDSDLPLERSPHPPGLTSIYGKRYLPAEEEGPGVRLRSDALVSHFQVRLLDLRDELYCGQYSVDDIFLYSARYLLRKRLESDMIKSDQGPFTYDILPSSKTVRRVAPDLLPEDAYESEGVFRLPPPSVEGPRIVFRKVEAPPLPERDPEELGTARPFGKGEPQAGRVFLPRSVYDELRRELELSDKKEEGGYLVGKVYRQPGSAEKEDDPDARWLVEVTDLVMAEDTVGSAALLLFTGDSWSKISRRIDRDFPGHKLVGWFHTHLFAATDDFGLSGLDQDMHAWYLPKPWQVAILLNLETDGERTVRCYQRGPDVDLVETPFEVLGA